MAYKQTILMSALALAFLVASAGTARAVFDCTSVSDFYSAGTTLTQDYTSTNGTVPCIKLRNGGTLNLNGHTITCTGTCSGAAVLIDTSLGGLTSAVIVKNGIISGNWAYGVDAITATQKGVSVLDNTITGLTGTAIGINGGTKIIGNVVTGDSAESAILWRPINTSIVAVGSQEVSDNYIDWPVGYGIRFWPFNMFTVSSNPSPDIHHNFVRGAITFISAETDSNTSMSIQGDVYSNVFAAPDYTYTNDPFAGPSASTIIGKAGSPNTCDVTMVAAEALTPHSRTIPICAPAVAPYTLP